MDLGSAKKTRRTKNKKRDTYSKKINYNRGRVKDQGVSKGGRKMKVLDPSPSQFIPKGRPPIEKVSKMWA